MDIASAIFNLERAKTRKNITLMSLNYSYAWWCIACHGPKYHNESKRLDSNIHFPFFVISLMRIGFAWFCVLGFST